MVVVVGKGVVEGVASGTGMGAESSVSSVADLLMSGAEVVAIGACCGLGSTSSRGLSSSSTVSIDCYPVASLSASFSWS